MQTVLGFSCGQLCTSDNLTPSNYWKPITIGSLNVSLPVPSGNYQLLVNTNDKVCPGQGLEVSMQINYPSGFTDPDVLRVTGSDAYTYKLFW